MAPLTSLRGTEPLKQNAGQRLQSSTVNMPVLLFPPERLLNRKNSKEWTPEEAEFYFDWLVAKKDIRVSDLLAHLKMEMAPMGEEVLFLKTMGASLSQMLRSTPDVTSKAGPSTLSGEGLAMAPETRKWLRQPRVMFPSHGSAR
jgi:hypothetical protein